MIIYDNVCKNMQKHAKTCNNMQNIFEGVRGVNLKNLLKTLGHHFDLTYKNEVDIKKLQQTTSTSDLTLTYKIG